MVRSDLTMTIFFIGGIPSSGKSWFGDWLEAHHGVVHVDAEIDQGRDLDAAGIHDVWDQTLRAPRYAVSLVTTLRAHTKPIVITWGFHPRYIEAVAEMKHAGMDASWFGGDWDAARVLHRRAGKSVIEFEAQRVAVEAAMPAIINLFSGRMIETVLPGPTVIPPEHIWQRILADPSPRRDHPGRRRLPGDR